MPKKYLLPSAEKYPKSSSVNEALEEIDKEWHLMKAKLGKITD